MDNVQTAKSVLKKLSALRATLLDEEQLYLDRLVMGSGKGTDDEPGTRNGLVDGALAQRALGSIETEQLVPGVDDGRITWNSQLEIYVLK